MITILSRDLPGHRLPLRRVGSRFIYGRIQARFAATTALLGPRLLRALIFLLVALIGLFIYLMAATDHYEPGALVIGSTLLIGLGASHSARRL